MQDLQHIRASEAAPAVARAFSKFMIAKPTSVEPVWQVNETLNVFCRVLDVLGPRVTNDFFKDRIGWLDYTRLLLNTPRYYPHIYRLTLNTLSAAEIVAWIAAWLRLGCQSASYLAYKLVRPLMPLVEAFIAQRKPRLALRLAAWHEAMKQIGRRVR